MMKRLCLLMTGALVYSSVMQAQDFTLTPAVVYDTTNGVTPYVPGSDEGHDYVAMHTVFTNISDQTYKFTWTNITDTTQNPEGWILTGVCDNIVCRAEFGDWYFGTPEQTEDVIPDGNFDMIVHIYAPTNGPNGTGIYKIKIETEEQTDTIVYMLTKEEGLGLSAISLNDKRVTLYPNPAQTDMQVYIDKGLNAQKLGIFSIVGRQEIVQNIQTGNEVTSVNIGNLAPGMYMVHLTDINGKLITSRKFIKQ